MGRPLYAALFWSSRVLAWPAAALHAALAGLGLVSLPRAVARAPAGRFRMLRRCWFAKAMRELLPFMLRGPAREALMARVRFEPPEAAQAGCVMASLRSPWLKLLSECCRERQAGRVIVRGGRSRFWREVAIGADRAGLRAMIAHLRDGGMLFVAMESFADRRGCPVLFLGETREASLLPARLAAAAQVPLMAVLPVEQAGQIGFAFGPAARVTGDDLESPTRDVMACLERHILDDPSSWNASLRGWVGVLDRSEPRREESPIDADGLAGHEGGGR